MSDHSYFPFIGLEVSHKDGTLGVIESLDRRKPYFFFVKFYDDVVSPQHASRLMNRQSESLLTLLPDEEPDADMWRLIVDCGEPIAFDRSNSLDWGNYLSSYLSARRSVTRLQRPTQLKDGAFYSGALAGELPDGNGVLRARDGSVYEGEFLLGKFEGNGTLTYRDKRVYQGMFHRGKAHGHGQLLWPNGDVYVGEWINGKQSGLGKLTFYNGSTYSGDWRGGVRSGTGSLLLADGAKYFGGLESDQYSGHGRFTWSNGAEYTGDWVLGKRHGFGSFRFADGRSYSGGWKDDQIEGHGVQSWPDGTVYSGHWHQGLKSGTGTLIESSGAQYFGNWQEDCYSGHGVMTWPNGQKYEGDWKNGKKSGQGVYSWADGQRYEGTWQNDKQSGSGVMSWPSGQKYEGDWKNGKRSGEGVFSWPSGQKYEGEWRDGVYSGKGKLTLENGNIFQGEFRNNQKHGEGVLTDKLGAVVKKGHWFEGNFVEQIRHSYSPLKSYRTVDLIQGSREWLEWRMRGIGASDAPVIMNENPWKSKAYLLKEKLGETRVWAGNAATRLGQEFEPIIRAHIERLLDMPLKPVCVQSTESDMGWMKASLDGISADGSRVFEIKFGAKVYEHVQKTNTIPGYHYGQLQHILAITGLPFIDYFCGFIDCPTIHIVVQRDEPYIEKMLDAEWDFVLSMEDAGHDWMK